MRTPDIMSGEKREHYFVNDFTSFCSLPDLISHPNKLCPLKNFTACLHGIDVNVSSLIISVRALVLIILII